MKYFLLLFSLVFFSIPVLSQQVQIFGKVTDLQGIPISDATVKHQTTLGTVTDIDGSFSIQIQAEATVKIEVQHIGYETIDTLIDLGKESKIFLDIKMKLQLNQLPDVEISGAYQNIFENSDYHIMDFTIQNDFIYLIIKNGRTPFLCKAGIDGTIIEEFEFEGNYERFHNSCLGGIFVVGLDSCAELHDEDGEVFLTNHSDINYFDKYIIPCKLKIDETLIFKGVSRHNKKIDYFRYFDDHNPHILYSVHDKASEKVSRYYYYRLIALYFMESDTAKPGDIDAGFTRDNLIAEGMWGGDIQDLVRSNLSHEFAYKYQTLGSQVVVSDLFVIDNKAYILDGLNNQIIQINDDLETTLKLDDFDQKGKIKIITDNKNDSYFLIDDMIYSIDIDSNKFSIAPYKNLKQSFFTQRNLLYQGTLYRLGRKSINTIQKTIFRDVLE